MDGLALVSPDVGIVGRVQNRLAHAAWFKRLRRRVMAHLPFPVLESDVRDVVYANWVVPLEAVAHLIPPGVDVMAVDGSTILTVLTYAHGHFGPAAAGPLRRLFPSPLQSNWRLYVSGIDGRTPSVPTVLFLANVFDSALHAVGTRMFSDVMLAHVAGQFEHRRDGDMWTSRAGGTGSAPSWTIRARETDDMGMPAQFASFFADRTEALRRLCLQDAAIAPVEDAKALAVSEIDLPIDIASVVPLRVESFEPGSLLREMQATAAPFCFRVPALRFRVLSERLLA